MVSMWMGWISLGQGRILWAGHDYNAAVVPMMMVSVTDTTAKDDYQHSKNYR